MISVLISGFLCQAPDNRETGYSNVLGGSNLFTLVAVAGKLKICLLWHLENIEVQKESWARKREREGERDCLLRTFIFGETAQTDAVRSARWEGQKRADGPKGRLPSPKWMFLFGKSPKGQGVISDPKKLISDFLYSKRYILVLSFGENVQKGGGGSPQIQKKTLQIYVN